MLHIVCIIEKLSKHMIEAQKKMMKQRDNLDKLLEERSMTIDYSWQSL